MDFRPFRRMRVLAVSLATVTATTTLLAIAASAGPASAAASSGCPGSKTGLPTASNVSASFTTVGNTTTYQFSSLVNEHPSAGVPGLIKYCVYPTPSALPTGHQVMAVGANKAPWAYATGSNNFAFVRPGGDPSNIALDGTSTTMGTATWKTVPTSQAIVLHINDPTMCASLYPGSSSATCFVSPSTGPVCNHGDSNVAYNANPTDVVDCLNPAIGFEATSTNEFGDRVALAGGTPTASSDVKLKVDFQDFACGVSGHWSGTTQDANNQPSPCMTTPGTSFTIPGGITANLYDPNGSGGLTTPIATVNTNPSILYRPSADPVNCPGPVGAPNGSNKWFNPNGIPGQQCQNSIGQVLTFDFGHVASLPSDVIWTVAFNTSHSGYSPIGEGTQCEMDLAASDQNPGCGYDSLNVGDHSLPGAPYSGTDPNEDVAYVSQGGTSAPLQAQTGWTGLRPLGEIIATP